VAPPDIEWPVGAVQQRLASRQRTLESGAGVRNMIALVPTDRLSRLERAEAEKLADWEPSRPKTREDCVGGLRPCPHVGCRHHLYSDVNERDRGATLRIRTDVLPWEMEYSCALDVADMEAGDLAHLVLDVEGATQEKTHGNNANHTLGEIGALLGVTREAVRQIEAGAVEKFSEHPAWKGAR
jgi:hypothetical protein